MRDRDLSLFEFYNERKYFPFNLWVWRMLVLRVVSDEAAWILLEIAIFWRNHQSIAYISCNQNALYLLWIILHDKSDSINKRDCTRVANGAVEGPGCPYPALKICGPGSRPAKALGGPPLPRSLPYTKRLGMGPGAEEKKSNFLFTKKNKQFNFCILILTKKNPHLYIPITRKNTHF